MIEKREGKKTKRIKKIGYREIESDKYSQTATVFCEFHWKLPLKFGSCSLI